MVAAATIRTPLFVPADRPERFAKAAASGADAVIVDLEDAVAAGAKEAARALATSAFTDLPVLLRVNSIDTPWHRADLAAARAGGFAAIVLPKAEEAETVAAVVQALEGVPLIALIETARGLANARAIATSGAVRLAFGSVDFCADLGCEHQRTVLIPARTELVLASRLARIAPPIDGVTVQLDDLAAAAADAAHARALGMTGKLCVHPKQVGAIQRALQPSAEEIVWAHRVLAAGEGAVAVGGAMVDEPVRMRARGIIAALPSGGS